MTKSEKNQSRNALYGRVVKSTFSPPWWAKNRHIQTIFPRFLQKRRKLNVKHQQLALPDGDFLDISWGEKPENQKGMVVLFHGLEGSVRSHYANDMMAVLRTRGFWPVLMHFRGCSGRANTLPRAYHSGETEDALFFLEWLNKQYPNIKKSAIGFSLGANMLLKLLGENPMQRFVESAVAVSPPLRLRECADSINQGFSRVYQRYLLNSMVANLARKMQKVDFGNTLKLLPNELKKLKSFRDFDEHVTAPLHGFSSANDYYARCSGIQFLRQILTPTLVLHAKDDPFMNEHVIPAPADLSSAVRYELSEQGGHVGFMHGTPWRPTIWMHERVATFFESQLDISVKHAV
ncbi:hydrolase [Aestuariibacter sp. AA17]|uniref:Hydrolase n=1 Tax=Fluctibacter corallii TaxID=2984329 RepID=A0ABT3AAW6_9ALTE|nr:hydrolase [Aestuariibacter sp. AA17]MCV2885816.1 hydrolase [Aestuariibacter sp. AA17]